MEVTKIGIGKLVGLFIGYIVLHVVIGLIRNNLTKKTEPTAEEVSQLKVLVVLYKWFPAIYLIFVLIFLYTI
jgi:membrane protein YqaA with SNARE-associated domain